MIPELYDISCDSDAGNITGLVIKRTRLQQTPTKKKLAKFLRQVRLSSSENHRTLDPSKNRVVYGLRVSGTPYPFYVGKGRERRPLHHFWSDSIAKRSYKNNIIKKAMRENKPIIAEILYDRVSDEEACALEMFLIDYFGRKDIGTGILVNQTDGGDGTTGAKLTENHKKLIGIASAKRRPSAYTKMLISEKLTGRKVSSETRLRISDGKRGKKPTEVALANLRISQNKPELREARSARRRAPDSVIVSRMYVQNPILSLVKSHVRPGYSVARCRLCGGEVTVTTTRLMKGYLPWSHYHCAAEIFQLKEGSQVYGAGHHYRKLRISIPEVPFDAKFSESGVSFYSPSGILIFSTKLPDNYLKARLQGERKLRT